MASLDVIPKHQEFNWDYVNNSVTVLYSRRSFIITICIILPFHDVYKFGFILQQKL